ncbi:MAG: MaoC family dehydratase [Defluviitaleaceae bacterium]|nr:MaoC family dehydratase [Defluviitaleaceae bacterium]
MNGLKMHEIEIGQSASYTKTVTETDVYLFAGISGDTNPVHLNEVYAKDSIFKTRVVHGLLTASLISTVLGTKLPGPGSIYAKQDLKFLAPVYFNDTITATCTAKEKIEARDMVIFECKVTNQDDTLVLVGDATIIVGK